jgi:hypothetical protein
MLISTSLLAKAIQNYKNVKKNKENEHKKKKERYGVAGSLASGVDVGFSFFLLMLFIIFFLLELFVLFYSIGIAIRCTEPGSERTVHVALSIFFTLPYALLAVFFKKCAVGVLRGGKQKGLFSATSRFGDTEYSPNVPSAVFEFGDKGESCGCG